jgi:hypothetical protein
MCRNHSHITTEITGLLLVGESEFLELKMRQPLEMQLPYGEKWTRCSGTSLYVPVSMKVPLPASTLRQIGVCYTPLSYTVLSDMTTGQGPQAMRKNVGGPGETRCGDMARLHQTEGDDNDLWG